jgi:glycosyltransferase involved in cell wall biosynthesis
MTNHPLAGSGVIDGNQPCVRPIHLAMITRTDHRMDGADRDCVALLNALDPDQFRVTWVGIDGCESLRPYINSQVVTRFVNIGLPPFPYLVRENAYLQRSTWLWTKILADHCLRMAKPLLKLRRELKHDRPDLIVTNTITVLLGAVYANLNRLPHVWLIKDCMNPNLEDCCAYARWIARLSSAVVAPSSAVARPFSDPVRVFADGTNVSVVTQSSKRASRDQILHSLGLPTTRPVVVQIGTFEVTKGQHVTADAFLRLATMNAKPDFSLLFLGRGQEQYRAKVEATLSKAPPAWHEAIRFSSFPPEDFSYLAATDIVVHPSMIPDTYPNAVREAMILGKPVIGSNDGGLPEMIEHGKTGFLFEPGNALEMAKYLRRLLDSPEERIAIGEAARRFAINWFDINVRKQPFSDLFHRLAEGGSTASLNDSEQEIGSVSGESLTGKARL